MERIKILAIVARLMFVSESDGMTCRVDSFVTPPRNVSVSIVDCVGKGRFRTFLVLPDGHVLDTRGRST